MSDNKPTAESFELLQSAAVALDASLTIRSTNIEIDYNQVLFSCNSGEDAQKVLLALAEIHKHAEVVG